jgi:addiction module HigA family antidote
MANHREHGDIVAFHPGYYVDELIEESGLSREEFARRIGVKADALDALVRGERPLTTDVASGLASAFGTSVTYWLNLQRSYDAACRRMDETWGVLSGLWEG